MKLAYQNIYKVSYTRTWHSFIFCVRINTIPLKTLAAVFVNEILGQPNKTQLPNTRFIRHWNI